MTALATAVAFAAAGATAVPKPPEWRWWTLAELHATDDDLVPGDLAAQLDTLLADGPPAAPVDVGP